MIAVVSDTHGRTDSRLRGRTETVVTEAGLVIHAGDFVREPVLDAFVERSTSFVGVYGNVDDDAVRERLSRAEIVTVGDFRIAVVHTVEGGATALELFGQERDADLVISGHTHQPVYTWTGAIGLLNPGSHAQPRGNRAAHAEIQLVDGALQGGLVEPDGTVFERFQIE